MDKKIVVFGSSISWGAWDEQGGWADRLKRFINKKVVKTNGEFYCLLYNQSVSGDTSTGILERFERELLIRHGESDKELSLIFEVGINDSLYINLEREFLTPKSVFRSNIGQLIKRSGRYTNRVVFMGAPPVVDAILDPVPWFPTGTYKTRYAEEYNRMLDEVCSDNKVLCLDVFTPFADGNIQELQSSDGVHPSTKGHEIYYEVVKVALEEQGVL